MKCCQLHFFAIIMMSLLFLTTSCQKESSSENTQILKIQVAQSPDILNPVISRTNVSRQIEELLYLPLAKFDEDENQWKPVLTEKFEIESSSDGGTVYKMTMHPDARWSDGQKIEVEDVVFTLKMGLNPYLESQSWANYIGLIDSVIIEEDELTILMLEPYILANEFIASLKPMPRHVFDEKDLFGDISFQSMKDFSFEEEKTERALESIAEDFNRYGNMTDWPEVISGPYSVDAWSTDQFLRLISNPHFWGDHAVGHSEKWADKIDTIQYVFISDPQNALNAFSRGHVDIVHSLSEHNRSLIEKNDGVMIPVPSFQMLYISLNHRQPLLSQQKIRVALSHMIDREDLLKKLFAGNALVAEGPIHPMKPYFSPSDKTFDIDRAAEIFEELGCEEIDGVLHCPGNDGMIPMQFHLWTTQTSLSRNVATLLKSYWRKLGVHLTIQSADFRTFLPELQNKTYEMATLALHQNNLLDDPYPLWHSSQAGQAGKNYQGMNLDSIDVILENLRQAIEPQKQFELYMDLQEEFYKEEPVLFLVAPLDMIGVHQDLDLFLINQRPGYDLFQTKWKR